MSTTIESSTTRPASYRFALFILGLMLIASPAIRLALLLILPSARDFGFDILMPLMGFLFVLGLLRAGPTIAWPGLSRPLMGGVLVFMGLTMLSAALSAQPAPNIGAQTEYLIWIAVTLGLVGLLKTDKALLPRICGWPALGLLPVFLWITLFVLLAPEQANENWKSMTGAFRNIRHFGDYTAIASLLVLVPLNKALGEHRRVSAVSWSILSVLCFTFLIWSGGRASIACPVLAVALALIVRRPASGWRLAAQTVGSFGAGLVLSLPISTASVFGIFRFGEAMSRPLESTSSGRSEMWFWFLEELGVADLLGRGPAAVSFEAAELMLATGAAHNIVLQGWYVWGWPATLIMLAGLLCLMGRAIRRPSEADEGPQFNQTVLVFAAILCWAGASLVEAIVGLTVIHPLLAVSVAALIACLGPIRSGAPSQLSSRGLVVGIILASAVPIALTTGARLAASTSHANAVYQPWRTVALKIFPEPLRTSTTLSRLITWADPILLADPKKARDWLGWVQPFTHYEKDRLRVEARFSCLAGQPVQARRFLEQAIAASRTMDEPVQRDLEALEAGNLPCPLPDQP